MLTYEPIGLDLSLTSTGVAIGRATWAIATKGLRDEERLIYIRDLISSVLLVNEIQKHSLEMYNALADKNNRFRLLQIS